MILPTKDWIIKNILNKEVQVKVIALVSCLNFVEIPAGEARCPETNEKPYLISKVGIFIVTKLNNKKLQVPVFGKSCMLTINHKI